MKRYNNLYDKIIDKDNLILAHNHAKRGKSSYSAVKMVNSNPDYYLNEIKCMLDSKNYKTSDYITKTIYEPKRRLIYKLPYYPDRIVHHAIMNVLQPIWEKTFISHVYSAIPGKGLHSAVIELKRWLKDTPSTTYCLKFDIKNFYPSVDHDILLNLIQRKIKCEDTLWLLEEIIRSPGGNKNIPIGNYLSQYFANIYLNPLDRFIKEDLSCRHYLRYGDDGVILSNDKVYLRECFSDITNYLKENLALTIHPKSGIFPVNSHDIDFLGYRFFRDYTLLRKSTAQGFIKRIKYIVNNYQIMNPQTIISSVMSYRGWFKYCNCYNLEKKYIIDNIDLLKIVKQSAERLGVANPLGEYQWKTEAIGPCPGLNLG